MYIYKRNYVVHNIKVTKKQYDSCSKFKSPEVDKSGKFTWTAPKTPGVRAFLKFDNQCVLCLTFVLLSFFWLLCNGWRLHCLTFCAKMIPYDSFIWFCAIMFYLCLLRNDLLLLRSTGLSAVWATTARFIDKQDQTGTRWVREMNSALVKGPRGSRDRLPGPRWSRGRPAGSQGSRGRPTGSLGSRDGPTGFQWVKG